MFVEQSWEAALAALMFSAERGWSAAQRQLRILAADRELAGSERVDPARGGSLQPRSTPAGGMRR